MTNTTSTGNSMGQENLECVQAALATAGKRAALAAQLNISESQFSKLLSGELKHFCELLACLGLQVLPTEYVAALRHLVKAHI